MVVWSEAPGMSEIIVTNGTTAKTQVDVEVKRLVEVIT